MAVFPREDADVTGGECKATGQKHTHENLLSTLTERRVCVFDYGNKNIW